ncbi:MAG: hypothetical protein OEU59_02170 [Gammaproteobacteria bacterium]|jgi:MFS family permease|nr:hypothetical protein [Gammaproteobacteria bacterium]MDH3983939.1 hypothetical protein [Gammaproteobacteria bacterium]
MEQSTQPWSAAILVIVVLLAAIPIYALFRIWRGRPRLSDEERSEAAASPLTRLQRNAWLGVAVGVAALGTIAVLITIYGVAEYWNNDSFRLAILGLFIGALVVCAVLLSASAAARKKTSRFDERDRLVLAQAGTYQIGFVLISLAIWLVALGERFHAEGAVPMVYLYLMFGSIVMISFIGQAAGILLGYWFGERFGQG